MRHSQFLASLTTPGWRRLLLIRRVLAALIVLLAALVFLVQHNEPTLEVVTAATTLPAGAALDADDLHVEKIPQRFAPAEALEGMAGIDDAAGKIAATTLAQGEAVTPQKLVGHEAIAAIASDPQVNRHLVPMRLADEQVIRMLHHGDQVSVVAAEEPLDGQEAAAPRVIAQGALVVLAASESGDSRPGGAGAALLLALPPEDAGAVAAAALTMPLTVVITGERASY